MSRPTRRLLKLLLVLTVVMVGWMLVHHRQRILKVTFLDVGQGDAIVIESPDGKVLVLDTGGIHENGGADEGERAVVPFLRSEGIRRIDTIVLTHPHADHIGGAGSLMERYPVGMLIDNGQETGTPVELHEEQVERERHVPHRVAQRGQTLDFGDGVTVDILAPTDVERQGTPNDASVVLRLRYGHSTFLLMGDAEAPEEQDLVAAGTPLACDVLKVGHHGSHTSTTAMLLAAAQPRIAIISVGKHNEYGHPSREVVARLRDTGIHVYRTDENGAVTCESDGESVSASSLLP